MQGGAWIDKMKKELLEKTVAAEAMTKERLKRLVAQQPTLQKKLQFLLPRIAQVGQDEYDMWEQDEEGYAEELGHGGICHLIADGMVEMIDEYIPEGLHVAESATHMQHVFVASFYQQPDGRIEGYSVDIHPHFYETGGGFCWKKIPDVEFDASMVELYPIDAEEYLDEEQLEWWLED